MAGIKARDSGGTLRTIAQIRARDSVGTLRTITRVRARDADNELHTLWEAGGVVPDDNDISLSTYDEFQSASGAAASGAVVSDAVIATPQVASAPYTYQWLKISGSSGITITSPTAASTTFSATVVDGTPKIAVYRCVVQSGGRSYVSEPLTVTLEWIDTR
jgi:hypothetical protein